VAIYQEPETEGAFLRGDSVFCRNWAHLYGLASDPSASKIKPEQVGIVPLPASQEGGRPTGTVGATTLFINAVSDKQDVAWEFIRYLSAPEQMQENAIEGAYLPPRYALYGDEELKEKVPVMGVGKEALLSATPRPVSPLYADMSLEMAEQFSASLKGDISPEQAVQTLGTQLKRIQEQEQEALS
jgi:multiple sugar transport system substrate-binding protein